MSLTQLSFSLRLSNTAKTVHLTGSWDNYAKPLPLSREKPESRSGPCWKGTYRFGPAAVDSGQRYWYYFIVDGFHYTINPNKPCVVEPTTGRELNYFDIPKEGGSGSGKHSSSSKSSSSKHSSSSSSKHGTTTSSSSSRHASSASSGSAKDRDRDRRSSRHLSVDIPKGRPLSISDIRSPKPVSPHPARHILAYDEDGVDALARQLGATAVVDEHGALAGLHVPSPAAAYGYGLSYRSDSSSPSSGSGSPSGSGSGSGYSTPSSDYSACTCERYGITRRGDRIKIECGGTVCGGGGGGGSYGYGDSDGSACFSGSEGEFQSSPVRRRGMLIR